MHYCYRCGEWRKLNRYAMCGPCMTMWLGMTPADRRRLMHVVTVTS